MLSFSALRGGANEISQKVWHSTFLYAFSTLNYFMKYIMFQDVDGRKIPFIFPNNLVHSQVAEVIKPLLLRNSKIVSAGEIKFSVKNCNGNSETLRVGVLKGDANIIHEYDYCFGFPNETGVEIP